MSTDNKNILIDPRKIENKDLPVFILSDNLRSFWGLKIKQHTQGNYCHIMSMHKKGWVATQSFIYHEVPITQYMKPYYRLKFWHYKNLSPERREMILRLIQADLNQPPWRKVYDVLGILGQAINLKWIQNPWAYYCSEREAKHMRKLPMLIPPQPTPSLINTLCEKEPNMEVLGYWFDD